jgi:hypothetical protein
MGRRDIEIFPGMSNQDLLELHYLGPNVVGELPKLLE